MSELFNRLQPYLDKSYALSAAFTLFSWDNSTGAPRDAIDNTSRAIGILSGEMYSTLINDEVKALLKELSTDAEHEKLTFQEKAIVKNLNKDFKELQNIPPEEFSAFSALISRAYPVWSKAKQENDFASYAPVLQEIITYVKKFASYNQKEGQKLYDVQLNKFEEGFNMEIIDDFFEKLRTALIPLVQKISEKSDFISTECLRQSFDVETQKKFCRFLAEYIGFDFNRGVMAESEHPFTTELHNHDVRITSHYYQHQLDSAIFSVIHEGGHAIYEMGVADDITMTPVGGGTSMGMHESQSRLYENNLGRSLEFWTPVYAKLQEAFPEQLHRVTPEEFYKAINYSSPSLIRTEADELTYSFHVMIRYEIEKMIFQGTVSVDELPALWNQKYQEYLGLTPANDTEGILQDMHWSGGDFGYFPSYALGSAIAAQIYHHLETVMPVKEYLKEGNLLPIREYLKEHIHRFGKCKNTQELLMEMTGEAFNPDYYITYLTEKYSALYEL